MRRFEMRNTANAADLKGKAKETLRKLFSPTTEEKIEKLNKRIQALEDEIQMRMRLNPYAAWITGPNNAARRKIARLREQIRNIKDAEERADHRKNLAERTKRR